jgi:hypothetical protein
MLASREVEVRLLMLGIAYRQAPIATATGTSICTTRYA